MIKFSKITISTLHQFEYSNKDKDKQKKIASSFSSIEPSALKPQF